MQAAPQLVLTTETSIIPQNVFSGSKGPGFIFDEEHVFTIPAAMPGPVCKVFCPANFGLVTSLKCCE
jgi:hypothetical protein